MEQSESVEMAARKVSGVIDVYSVSGIYDLIVRVEGEDESKLGEVIKKIKRLVGVTATHTSIVYNNAGSDEAATSDRVVTIPPYRKPTSDNGGLA